MPSRDEKIRQLQREIKTLRAQPRKAKPGRIQVILLFLYARKVKRFFKQIIGAFKGLGQ